MTDELERIAIELKHSLLRERQAADLLGFSVRTLQGWRYRGGGPKHIKIGNRIRYRLSDLHDWIEANTRS